MIFDVVVSEERYNDILKYGFTPEVGYWLWNGAVFLTPEDTGNARSATYLGKNKPRHIQIKYDFFKANYIKFLEEGIGPVKKYKGYISQDTTALSIEQLISWITSGKVPQYIWTTPQPIIKLKESKNKPFSKERLFLKQANLNANSIDAKQRQKISMIRSLTYGISRSPSALDKPSKTKLRSSGSSMLQKIYNERKNNT